MDCEDRPGQREVKGCVSLRQRATPERNEELIAIHQSVQATNGYVSHLVPSLAGPDGVLGTKAHMVAVQASPSSESTQLQYGVGYANYWHYLHQRLPRWSNQKRGEAEPSEGIMLSGYGGKMGDYDDTTLMGDDGSNRKIMLDFLADAFPQKFSAAGEAAGRVAASAVLYEWSGIMGYTINHCSIVGWHNKDTEPGQFLCVGHNGEGMARCHALALTSGDAVLAYLRGKEFEKPDWFPESFARNL